MLQLCFFFRFAFCTTSVLQPEIMMMWLDGWALLMALFKGKLTELPLTEVIVGCANFICYPKILSRFYDDAKQSTIDNIYLLPFITDPEIRHGPFVCV